jgi:predicted SAM-dependent methyltransferase
MVSKLKKFAKEKLPHAIPIVQSAVISIKHRGSRQKIRRLLKEGSDICINVGAGDIKGQGGWITIDIAKNCDIFWDLRKGLPFPDESVNKVYSSHFFEHLSFKETQGFLLECKRVLVSGGKFSICVPNTKLFLDAYMSGNSLDPIEFLSYKPAYNQTTKIDYLNYIAYMDGEHKYMFDEENLLYILESKGFKNVHLRQFDPSIDQLARDSISIYAEAEK